MFEVGKEVVCIKTHSRILKKGQRFTLQGIKRGFCNCHKLLLDVGLKDADVSKAYLTYCSTCGARDKPRTENTLWFFSERFAPIDNTLSNTTVEEILTEIGELELINE